MKSAGLAGVLSFFVSGLGQINNGHTARDGERGSEQGVRLPSGNGQILKGLVILVVQIINGALTTILIGWIPLAIVWVWAIIDAYREAERINARRGLR